MSAITPTIGRIVLYTLPQYQVDEINRRRRDAVSSMDYHRWKKNGAQIHVGNEVKAGQVVPAMVVAVWGDTPTCAVNLKIMLDGTDDYWATSTSVEDSRTDPAGNAIHTPGKYHWMPYQIGQAVKHAAEAPAA